MTSDYRRFRASLLRRFSLTNEYRDDARKDYLRQRVSASFALQYLAGDIEPSGKYALEVAITQAALQLAFQGNASGALELINKFAVNGKFPIARKVVTESYEIDNSGSLTDYCDEYLFGSPDFFPETGTDKRLCYQEILGTLDIELPFSKRGMAGLAAYINPALAKQETATFAEMHVLVSSFVKTTWPLFERSILDMPIMYFDFDQSISAEQMRNDMARLRCYGLERLQARLIVLRAVCDDGEAMASLELALGQCGYSADDEGAIRLFLAERRSSLSEESFKESSAKSILLRATMLIIYVRTSRRASEFVTRLIFAYSIDKTILGLVNWFTHLDLVHDAGVFYTAELVALAAIFSEESILRRSPDLKNRYIPTSAGTDLSNYAKHCREENKMTAFQFFHSFQRLPGPVRERIFLYLLSPGTIDIVSGIFPYKTKLIPDKKRNGAVNALSLKLDCISYLKRHGPLRSQALSAIEEETRQRLRQVRYETDLGSGRIRVDEHRLSQSIQRHMADSDEWSVEGAIGQPIGVGDLEVYLRNRGRQAFCYRLARFICFESRFSFDYLMSHLRHNLLRFKLESAVDAAFHSHMYARTGLLKAVIEVDLEEYCQRWLTISKERSFFAGLVSDLEGSEASLLFDRSDRLEYVSNEFAILAISRFSSLLADCRRAWRTTLWSQVASSVDGSLDEMGLQNDTALRERLVTALKTAFSECEKWLNLNDNPMSPTFGLKDLFLFESTNFSSAKTRVQPFIVSCIDATEKGRVPHITARDIQLPGRYFDAMVQLVQNLLENAYDHSELPITSTKIDVSIIALEGHRIRIEFRNNFDPQKRELMQERFVDFNSKIDDLRRRPGNAPAKTGGSGTKRIVFEFDNIIGAHFSIKADNSEFSKRQFLIVCEFTNSKAESNTANA